MTPPGARILVCTSAVDMRKSFDGLAQSARQLLGQDPQGGALFVFVNRRGNRLKCLWWDRTGYVLLYKRLHQATFRLPRPLHPGDPHVWIDPKELSAILEGVRLPKKKSMLRAA